MKVMHIGCPYLPYKGGSTARLLNLVSSLDFKTEGISQYLVTPTLSNDKSDDKYFESVYRVENINALGFNRRFYNILREVDPDVIVTHNSKCLLNWLFFYRFKFKCVKVVNELHSFREGGLLKLYINKVLYRLCDKLVCLSKSSKNYLSENYNIKNSVVVYNGIESVQKVFPSKIYDPKSITYAYVGSFHNWQGVNIIADSVIATGKDFWRKNSIYLVGNGPEYESIKAKLDNFSGGEVNIYTLGWQSKEKIDEIVSKTDLLLATRPSSTATETVVPLKVVDSIDYLKPLVATNVGGLEELLVNSGKCAAFFIDKFNNESLLSFFKSPPTLQEYNKAKEQLSVAALNLPTWSDSAKVYISIYKSLVSK
ncbi:glycosyltransferase [Pseudoalteromonas galatheae]|uniref:glycosyltransferase n=1 Tax=Pseudoalteromonas galatheae TaxID=579562 RepID=UPI0030D0A192